MEPLPFIVFAAWLLSAVVPITVARRSGTLYGTDLALIFAPAVGFLVTLHLFNEPALTGWAFILVQLLLLALSVAVLHVRVFLLPRFGMSARAASRGSLLVALSAAFALGVFIKPWYE